MRTKCITLDSRPLRLWVLLVTTVAAAAMILSFGCGSGGDASATSWYGQQGATDAPGAAPDDPNEPDAPGAPATANDFTILSTFSDGDVVDLGEFNLISFTFDTEMDTDAADPFISVYLKQLDGDFVEIQKVTLSWLDRYNVLVAAPFKRNSIYKVVFASGLRSIDLRQLSQDVSFLFQTSRNLMNIDRDDADTDDLVTGSTRANDWMGIGVVLHGEELFSDVVLEMPLFYDLQEENEDLWQFPPFGTPATHFNTGYEAQNLGNVGGSANADFMIGGISMMERPQLLFFYGPGGDEADATFNSLATMAVRSIGDVNGDGRNDFIIMENGIDRFTGDIVQDLYLFLGRDDFSGDIEMASADAHMLQPAYPDIELPVLSSSVNPGSSAPPPEGDMAVLSIAPIGDFNGDGLDDFAIGSVDTELLTGTISIHLGATTAAELATTDITIYTGVLQDLFGISVSGGDVNGDGFSDIIAGAPLMPGLVIIPEIPADISLPEGVNPALVEIEETPRAKAYLFNGSGDREALLPATQAAATFLGPELGKNFDLFGASVVIADFVNPGLPDIAIGAPFSQTLFSTGRVYFFEGSRSLTGEIEASDAVGSIANDIAPMTDDWGDTTTFILGPFMTSAGDVNNDGYKDLNVMGITMGDWGPTGNDFNCVFLGGEHMSEMNLNCGNASEGTFNMTLPTSVVMDMLFGKAPK